MDATGIVQQLLENTSAPEQIAEPLPDDIAEAVVERLKQEADRHWWINANRSLELAEMIIHIGQARNDLRQIALGTMARGDALKLLDRRIEAWEALEHAGSLFQSADDEIGWARTRIGRLGICVGLNRVNEALNDAERARKIFSQHQEYEKLLRLDWNTAVVYNLLGDRQYALKLYYSALSIAQSLGEKALDQAGVLHTNIGFTYEALGDFREALTHHRQACDIAEKLNDIRTLAIAETNIAIIAIREGYYRRALSLLHRAHELYVSEKLLRDAAEVDRIIVECYLLLNRYAEARDLAKQVRAAFHEFGESYEEALTLIELATAEAELGQFEAAKTALDTAEPILHSLEASEWIATTQLRRGQIALRQGRTAEARREALAAAERFERGSQQIKFAAATLLQGQVALLDGDVADAKDLSRRTLQIAKRCNVPSLRYSAHLLLGRITEAQADLLHAARHYHAAAATVERVQRYLTITLRSGFLEDKEEAIRALLGLHLRAGNATRAFETLERAKSQVLLSYLTNREQLRWANDDPRSRALIKELDQLRAEHQWFYEIAHDQLTSDAERPVSISPEQALIEVATRERRMRAITEQLYLHKGEGNTPSRGAIPSLADIRSHLSDDTLLVEFYNDGATLWAFTLDTQTIDVQPLPMPGAALDQLLAQFQVNLAATLKAGPDAQVTRGLTTIARRILQRLYDALCAPIAHRLHGRQRLAIVPYGSLHYLPFHLLHTGEQYLVERYEVVILPAAGLATHRGPQRGGGARVLAHSWDSRLPHTLAEAKIVQSLFGGTLYSDQAACRTALQADPTQILHVAAHGEHRLDQPDLSYIQLADGQLYTDDLLQQDLSYELVTLSACETGRANVAAGDELIGLGRGFLYAGAGALIVSLWRVVDDTTLTLMEHTYRALRSGSSKAAALREAQRALHAANPDLHPAFWGAFQLVGDAAPLSRQYSRESYKEQEDVFFTTEAAQ